MSLVHLKDEAGLESVVSTVNGAHSLKDDIDRTTNIIQSLYAAHVRVDQQAASRERVGGRREDHATDANGGTDRVKDGIWVKVFVGRKPENLVVVAGLDLKLVLGGLDAIEQGDDDGHHGSDVVDEDGHDGGDEGRIRMEEESVE